MIYYDKEKHDRDLKNSELSEALEKGIKQGIEQEKIEIAKSMLKENINIDIISKITGLTLEQLNLLR